MNEHNGNGNAMRRNGNGGVERRLSVVEQVLLEDRRRWAVYEEDRKKEAGSWAAYREERRKDAERWAAYEEGRRLDSERLTREVQRFHRYFRNFALEIKKLSGRIESMSKVLHRRMEHGG